MKKIIFISLTSLLFFSSCEEDLHVDLPGAEGKLVIEGKIESGAFSQVLLTKNVPLFSSVAGANLQDYLVLDAEVYVSNGIITDTLELSIDTGSVLGLIYKGSSIVGIPGQTYYLTVNSAGKTYTATTTIPTPVALDSVWWQPQPPEDSLGYAWAHFSEPPGLGNNFRWFAKRPKDRRYIAPWGATFDDKFVDGKVFDFAYNKGYDPTDTENTYENDQLTGEGGYYRGSDTIYIKFCTMDKDSKDFYTTFEAALSNNGNPFASPVTVLTNIQGGGLGVWCGYGVTFDTIMPVQ